MATDKNRIQNYKAYIKADGKPPIDLYLPENFNLNVRSQYDTPFAQGLPSSILPDKLGKAVTGASNLTGISTAPQAATAQIWQGSAPIEFQIPFILVAERSARADVLNKIRELMKLVMPSKTNGFLTSPGPKIEGISELFKAESYSNKPQLKDNISLHIGRFIYYKSVVITDVDSTYDTKMDVEGIPIRAVVNVSFKTFFTPVKEDLDEIFGGGPQSF